MTPIFFIVPGQHVAPAQAHDESPPPPTPRSAPSIFITEQCGKYVRLTLAEIKTMGEGDEGKCP
jgi:hypothetical protein